MPLEPVELIKLPAELKSQLRWLETIGKPVVAPINGARSAAAWSWHWRPTTALRPTYRAT